MFTQYWTSRAAIFTTIGMLISVTLPAFTNKRVFAQTPPFQSQCSDANIKKYIKQLDKAEPAAFNALVECNFQAVSALIKALNNQDENAKIITVALLGEIGENAAPAIPYFTKLLNDKNQDINIIAAHTLGEIGEAAIPALIKALKDNRNWQVRYIAADALGQMGAKAKNAIPALIKARTTDKDSDVRTKAGDVINKIRIHRLYQVLSRNNQEISTKDERYEAIRKRIVYENKNISRFRTVIRGRRYGRYGRYGRGNRNSYYRYRRYGNRNRQNSVQRDNKQTATTGTQENAITPPQQNFVVKPRSVKQEINIKIKSPLIMCKIPVLKAIFKWKCPSKDKK